MAERYNRTIVETVRCLISDSKLGKSFWAEALSTAVYLRNRSPSPTFRDKTPYEILYKRKPSVAHLRVFGCLCYSHVAKDERSKLDSKACKCVFLGYSSSNKGYHLFDLSTRMIVLSRDVIFDENSKTTDKEEPSIVSNVDLPTTDSEPIPRMSSREHRAPSRLGEWVYSCKT